MSLYETVFQIVNQKSLETEGIYNLCCLCFSKINDEDNAILIEDEVFFDYNGGVSTEIMMKILSETIGDEFIENIDILKSICNPCSKLAIGSYKFIRKCKDYAEQFNNAVVNVINCFNNTTDSIENFQTMYVSINPTELTFEQFYDNKRELKEHAFRRFQFLAHGKHVKGTQKRKDGKNIDEDASLPLEKTKRTNRPRDFSTIFIKTHELMDDPASKEFTCKLCKKTHPTSGSLRLHFFSVHFKKEFKCTECPKSFGTAGLLRTHEKECHCTVTCSQCNKKLLNRTSTLKRHILTHIAKHKVCHRCGRSYKKITDFNRHIQQDTCDTPSRVPGNYICDYCSKKCHFRHQLMAHIRYEHGNAKGHVCQWCGRKCYNESALKTHILKHTGEKNFICSTCGGKFVTRQSLINHTRLHTGERPYGCQYCDQSFLSASRRSEHVERHHTEAIFECDLCDAKYNAKRSLQKHRKKHFQD